LLLLFSKKQKQFAPSNFSIEVLGVHYPSDEEAARKLAHQMLTKMWEKAAFKKDFQTAKAEWENVPTVE